MHDLTLAEMGAKYLVYLVTGTVVVVAIAMVLVTLHSLVGCIFPANRSFLSQQSKTLMSPFARRRK